MGVEILEQCRVAPPRGSVPPTTIRLTCFDLVWAGFPFPTERVFLYDVPACSTSAFLELHLPNLRRSLSLALKHFHPLAGILVLDPATPFIRYSNDDSVPLTVATSNDNLRELSSDMPREATRLRCLVPPLSAPTAGERALLALQVTLFPDQGIAVGVAATHAAMDGSSFLHFVRTWASICRTGCEEDLDLPVHDRSLVPDIDALRDLLLAEMRNGGRGAPAAVQPPAGLVRATFVLTAADLERLRGWVAAQIPGSRRQSSFALAIGLAWTCVLRTGHRPLKETEWIIFPADCRRRFRPALSASYFGNCIVGPLLNLPGRGLACEEGVAAAAAAITEAVKKLEVEGGLQVRLEEMVTYARANAPVVKPASVAGSPRLAVYRVDFGWGTPSKVEIMSIDGNQAIALAENRREAEGGLELGLSFPAAVIDNFARIVRAVLAACPPLDESTPNS